MTILSVLLVTVALSSGLFIGVFAGKYFPDSPGRENRKYYYLGIGAFLVVVTALLASYTFK